MGESTRKDEPVGAESGDTPVPLCVVGRNRIFRLAMRTLLRDTGFDVVCDADDIDGARAQLAGIAAPVARRGVLLYDVARGDTGIAVELQEVRKNLPDTPIVVLNSDVNLDILEICLENGVSGYLDRNISLEILLHSLELVRLGEKVFPTDLAELLVSHRHHRPLRRLAQSNARKLSEREWEILECLVDGDSNKQIAIRLNITESTVKVHMKSLLRKIEADNRTQAAIWAVSQLSAPRLARECSAS